MTSTENSIIDHRWAERYRAVASRDTRFDGQFITGVHSTGIYCRPSCPAMTPHAKNVSFYRTAAAAHEAGLRACKRCLPDAVPGSPDWNLRDDLASRAMRLLTDGVVEREGVAGLSSRLGYTSRHVTRVLVAELGAGPLALARANRAHNARTLLTSTDLPIADVAFAAGFSSVRQFNDTVQAVYGSTPSALRSTATVSPATTGDTTITLRLPAREPFDGPGIMAFLKVHAIAGVETASTASFSRLIRLPGGIAGVELSLDGAATVVCTARLSELSDVTALVARIRRLFDLDADSVAIDSALSADEHLAPFVARRPGIRLPGAFDPDEVLLRTMLGQQISVAAATTALGRLSAELSTTPGLFPTAAEIAARGSEVLRGPAMRISNILKTAESLASGKLLLDVGMSVDKLTATLVAQPGIGPWTAGYVAMRVLGAPDVLLASDLVMRASAGALGLPSTTRDLALHGARWAPWRSYAGIHLWGAAGR